MKQSITTSIACLLILIISGGYVTSQAQITSYDYESYPQLDVTYEHLEGMLEIGPQGGVKGDISYDIRFNIELSDSITLHAPRMLIEDVLLDERTMDFEIHNDSLVVYLDETFARSQRANLRVVYSTTPVFGLLRTYRGTLFTSQLPKSTRHWLPIADYPSIMVSYDITVRHTAGKSLVMSGALVSNEVISVDEEETRYRSATRRPVSSLFFALSDFQSVNRVINSTNIRLHIEQPNSVDLSPEALIGLADETISRMEDLTRAEYPYSNLHLVAMHDLVWEDRTFGAGTIILDVDRDLEEQVLFGVMGQWAGVQLREMQWGDADALQLLHGYFGRQLGISSIPGDTLQPRDALYKKISLQNIDRYKYHIDNQSDIGNYLSSSKEQLFKDTDYPLTWQDFTRILYRETGRLLRSKPEFEKPESEEDVSYMYRVSMNLNREQNEARIRFEADGVALEELVAVNITQFAFNDSSSSELTFTGENDEVVISLLDNVENIEFSLPNRGDVTLRVEKPFMFWIYQLRNSEDELQRLRAAEGLRQYADNPDLQLAILDMIRTESSNLVKAEILETLRLVTDGASGTSQLFLERIGEDQPDEVRRTATRSLAAYPGNDRVAQTLRSLILSADDDTLKIEAITSLSAVADTAEYVSMVESLIVRESVLHQVPVLLTSLVQKGADEAAVQLADTFLSREFPYDVRVGALNVIFQTDRSQDAWNERLENLLADPDPRIRYRAVEGLQFMNDETRSRLVETRLIEEHDARVGTALRNYR